MLLRVPGIGVNSAKRIVTARKAGALDFAGLKRLGVVLKRAQYFITCKGKLADGLKITQDGMLRNLISQQGLSLVQQELPQTYEQLSLFSAGKIKAEEVRQCLSAST